MSTINKRIADLRKFMTEHGLHAFIIPSTDPHMSEYPPAYWESRAWLSGFSGSAGTLVVTLNKSGLWTDSRYFIQAVNEMKGSEIVLFKDRLPETPSFTDWLIGELEPGNRVGIDAKVYAARDAFILKTKLDAAGIGLVSEYDPFESIWDNRPPVPKQMIFTFSIKYAGESAASKIGRIRETLKMANAGSIIISTLDAIAWTFNIRGKDVLYNPVAIAYAFISLDDAILFIDEKKVSEENRRILSESGIRLAPYDSILSFISSLQTSVCVDSSKLSYAFYNAIPSTSRIVDLPSPADRMKSIKNETEIAGFRKALVQDGIALVHFGVWLEKAVSEGKVTEYTIGEKLKELRSERENFQGESFCTIAGYGPNAALNHYHPTAETAVEIKPEGLLLVDSGGQYLDGTTDITRTYALGTITPEMKKDYTLVLKGNIGLNGAVFPKRTRGSQIDILARDAMWKLGINYGHGTGHGIGHFLNVHEGPQSIRPEENSVVLEVGMVMSNEPGIYRDYRYGIRIENLMLVKPAISGEYGDFYAFEALTLCPIDTAPIIKEMLTDTELEWLNNYHRTVYDKLSPYLPEPEKIWLRNKTAAI